MSIKKFKDGSYLHIDKKGRVETWFPNDDDFSFDGKSTDVPPPETAFEKLRLYKWYDLGWTLKIYIYQINRGGWDRQFKVIALREALFNEPASIELGTIDDRHVSWDCDYDVEWSDAQKVECENKFFPLFDFIFDYHENRQGILINNECIQEIHSKLS